MTFRKTVAALCLGLVGPYACATEGALDPAFGSDGFARNGLQGGNGDSAPMAIASDGRIATCATASGGFADIVIARFLPSGQADLTFAGSGKLQIDFAANADYCTAIAVQADGKIVVAGWTFNAGGSGWDLAVARVTADGSLDASFGGGTGKATISFNAQGSIELANGLAVQADGGIVLAGYTSVAGHSEDFAVVRLLEDGSLDSSFNGSGLQTISFDLTGTGARDRAASVAIDSQQRIVLGGIADAGSFQYDFAVARLLPDGELDPAFGEGGRATVAFDSGQSQDDQAMAMTLLHDGGIALAGFADDSATATPNRDLAIARLLEDGSMDMGFGDAGRLTIPIDLAANGDDELKALTELDDGRLLAVGYAYSGLFSEAVAVRVHGNGSLDASFGTAGIRLYDFFPSSPPYGGQHLLGVGVHGPWMYASAWIISQQIPQEQVLIRLQGDAIFIDGFDG